jgi:NIMA-interacting peptidyl-prolyl cis-trans isomerase 1
LNTETKESVWEKPEGIEIAPSPIAAVSEVRASHLLVKHAGSRRPSSWKQDVISRSRDEALDLIMAYRERIMAGETNLEMLAKTESDCSSAKKGGDLGPFGPGQMQRMFFLGYLD